MSKQDYQKRVLTGISYRYVKTLLRFHKFRKLHRNLTDNFQFSTDRKKFVCFDFCYDLRDKVTEK